MFLAFGTLAAAFGAAFGSFLNVVAYRLPRGESLVHPRSRCPHCGVQIASYDNIPVLSWFLLRGRCRKCKGSISPRYLLVEAVTALLVCLVALTADSISSLALGVVFVLLLVPVTLIDLEHRIIPNKLTLLGAVLGFAIVATMGVDALKEHSIAAVAAGLFLFVPAFLYPAGMGMGDVKLVFVMGLFLGRAVAPAVFIAMLLGAVVGVAIMARMGSKEGRKVGVPFGPFLAVGGLIGLFAGDALVDLYLKTF